MSLFIHSPLLLHKMYSSIEKKEKGEEEFNFRLKQSTISYVQEVILSWGAALHGWDPLLTFHS